jgi:nicotinate dehydrogenase subunit B
MTPHLTRRELGAALGALVVGFSFAAPALAQDRARLPGMLDANRMLDAWLRINPDGSVTVFTGRVELGQGAVTALAQIAAEELEVPFARVAMVAGDTALTPDEGHTSGSLSIELGGMALRLAGAEARAILLERAASRLGVPVSALHVENGVVVSADGRRVDYGKLAADARAGLHREATAKVAPRPPASYRIVGQSIPRLDIPRKVTGGLAYVQDLRLPGMTFGRVCRPPSYRATLTALDAAAVRRLPGVLAVVRDGNFLGVVAQREEQAIHAREALGKAAQWTVPADLPDPGDVIQWLKGAPGRAETVSEKSGQGAPATRTLEAAYSRRFIAHAAIGPSCAVAQWSADKLHVWSHTQGVYPLRRDLAKALRMAAADIRCTHMEGSGCYGHNGADDAALDAALLSRAVHGRPVKLQWMRDDEFAWEPYGSAMAMHAKAGLAADGSIVDWHYEVWSNTHGMRPGMQEGTNLLGAWLMADPQPAAPPPNTGGDRNAVPLYDFPMQQVVYHLVTEMPVRVSALRSLGGYGNVFALESFMDELALAADADPVEFRLRHLKDPRARAVIAAAAKQAGWQAGAQGDGTRGRGIGFARYKNTATYVACIAEVAVDRASGRIAVPRIVAAVDAGLIVNPDGLELQIEGGIIQGTSWTLHEEVAFDRQRITSRDWSGYPILTFPEVPKVEVTLIDRPDEKPLGAGEASQGPAAAAIVNAVAHATGHRIRDLPLRPERVKAALGSA